MYNGAAYLDQSLASLAAQDFTDFEVIVVDDGSTDATAEIAARWAASDPRFILVRRNANGGAARALNSALNAARGEYLARHDCDDIAVPRRFSQQVAFLDSHPEVVVVSMSYVCVDEQGRSLGRIDVHEEPEVLGHLLHFMPALGVGGQTMFRAETVRRIGGWSDELRLAQGWDLWTRMLQYGGVAALPQVGMYHRRHTRSTSARHRAVQMANAVVIARRTLARYLGREVTQEEAEAVGSVCFDEPQPNAAPLADVVLREAHRRFEQTSPRPRHLRRARIVIARRFARAAVLLARQRRLRGALRHGLAALRWHFLAFPLALSALARGRAWRFVG